MNKKLVLVCSVIVVFCFAGFLSSGLSQKAEATTVSGLNMFKSISILGVGVTPSGGAKFNLIDMDDDELASTTLTLPSLSGNNGMMVIYKIRNHESQQLFIQPASGDTIEGGDTENWMVSGYSSWVTFVADTANGTWWVVDYI